MNIFLDNVNIESTTGPNHFASKLVKQLLKMGHELYHPGSIPDVHLAFVESLYGRLKNATDGYIPMVQRLDGIYFDPTDNFAIKNQNILGTYRNSDAVVFQSRFSKELVFKYFGEHKNSTIIHNGADMEAIKNTPPHVIRNKNGKVWCAASHWRPFKRLDENIRYFLENSSENDVMLIAGETEQVVEDSKLKYLGELSTSELLGVYKASDTLVHLGRYDNCPNVVVDARACGCEIVCSSVGGTKEIAGKGAIVIEDHWDLSPEEVNVSRPLDFSKQYINDCDTDIDMVNTSEKYGDFLSGVIDED